jgi:hypothetical protein
MKLGFVQRRDGRHAEGRCGGFLGSDSEVRSEAQEVL